jgi:hypothetical protein
VQTADCPGNGTDGQLSLTLVGERGDTGACVVRSCDAVKPEDEPQVRCPKGLGQERAWGLKGLGLKGLGLKG